MASKQVTARSSRRIPALVPLVSLLAASSLPGTAALIAYDTFSGYTAGQLVGQNQGSGMNAWAGATDFQVTTSGGLTHASLSGTGGTANTGSSTANGQITLSRTFSSTLPDTGTIYIGFLLQQPAGNSPHGAAFSVEGDSGETVWAGAWNGTANWELARLLPPSTYSNFGTSVAESTSTTLFVFKLELTAASTDTVRIFVNPANAAALGGTGNTNVTFTHLTNDFGDPTKIGFFRENQTGRTGNVSFDEIRIGTAPEDMFAAIPEPSAALLGGLSLLLTLRRRR